ncbi:MAG TPA: metalloregulator ArsR/SmtB family transcription factor [Actinomycetota bacterium]|nr:metalloregulator ArsR/SmtB family transcription factor [Actinomycetota bacterium]
MSGRDERVAAVFQALSDPTRRAVVRALSEHGEGATATELAGEFLVTRQAVSKHLAALAEAGLVESERIGRAVRYRLTPRPMAEAMGWMAGVGAEWDERLAALRRHLRG